MKTLENAKSELSQAHVAKTAAENDLKAATEITAAAVAAMNAAKPEDKAKAEAASADAAHEQTMATRELALADAEVEILARQVELLTELADIEEAVAKAKKGKGKTEEAAADTKPRYSAKELAEKWLLKSNTEYRVNHPDGTVFTPIAQEVHVADEWVRDNVAAGLLIKTGVAG